jgi:pimeloyl-ACP methyl ester carboxylesterase
MNLPAHTMIEADAQGATRQILYLLHGFLGAGRNWASFGRRLVERRPDWTIALVDLRLHGDSRHIDGPHSVAAAAQDVEALHRSVAAPGTPCAVLGHSFGGKVALELASMLAPDLRQAWIVDSTPAPSGGTGSSGAMLDMLDASPEQFADREAAVRHVMQNGFEEATARWMATNLRRSEQGWAWDLDGVGLRELLDSFGAADMWDGVENARAGLDLHFVRASTGSILSDEAAHRLEAAARDGASVGLHSLEGGHWLHIDNPAGLLDLVGGALPVLES